MAIERYSTIKQTGKSEIVEKKSRFICEIRHVESEEEANLFFDEIKKKYWDARHNCSAFVIGKEQLIMRSSDDGEPSGTAGKPILEVLTGNNLTNVAAIVTRYFGGTLLGTGGLVRAYSLATSEALQSANIATYEIGEKIEVICDYSTYGKIQNFTLSQGIKTSNPTYTENVRTVLDISSNKKDYVLKSIADISNGKAKVNTLEICWIEI